jgi:hypothetical protein
MTPMWAIVLAIGLSHEAAQGGGVVYTLTGNHDSEYFGTSVAALDDIDGDGAPDFAASAAETFNDPEAKGYVKVFSGKTGEVLRTWRGERQAQWFGDSICSIQDRNGDGKREVVICDARDKAFIYSPMSGELLTTIDTVRGLGSISRNVMAIEDIDDDGYEEILVGQSGHFPNSRVALYSGKDGRMLWDRLGDFENSLLGFSIAGIGDVDGDGKGDVAAGQPQGWTDPWHPKTGKVYILGGADGREIRALELPIEYAYFGSSLASLGDLDGDGYVELAIGAVGHSEGRRTNIGWIGIYSTRTFEVIREFEGIDRTIDMFHGDQLGISASTAGDADGDGTPDILITAVRAGGDLGPAGRGRVDLRSGRTGKLLTSFEDRQEGGIFGSVLSPLGDLDGDGMSEFIIASPAGVPKWNRGKVVVARYDLALPRFLRADANGDGRADISDACVLAEVFYMAGDPGPCPLALDVDGDGINDPFDLLGLLVYLFMADLAPAPPFPDCGRYGGVEDGGLECGGSTCPP